MDALQAGQSGPGKRQACVRRKAVHISSEQAEELIDLADPKNLKIMVDHTFLFRRGPQDPRADRQRARDLYYYDSLRVNLGLFRRRRVIRTWLRTTFRSWTT
jgi:hypothetical protein